MNYCVIIDKIEINEESEIETYCDGKP